MSMAASQSRSESARILVVMGVAGSGKSTIGEALADALGCAYLDGDAYHPEANIKKMERGEPLNDADRWPWLETFARELAGRQGQIVGGCSSLKRAYRNRIRSSAGEPVCFIYLQGSKDLIRWRIEARTGHFMPPSLLDSQFATLEEPAPDENAISVGIELPTSEIVEEIIAKLRKDPK
jgi:gluconokinase